MNPAPRTVVARTISSLLLSALLGAGPAQGQSPGSTIAGPYTVTLPSTKTFSFSIGFKAPTPIQGSYLLRVELGTANSLSTLSVRLNSVQLYSLSDFAGGVTRVDKVVTLLASNTLSLSVAGAKGTRITLTVFTVVLPKPTALDPNPLALTMGTGGTLTATLSPAPTAAGSLSVSSSNPSVASVPGSVAFAAGQSSVAIAVNALAPGTATITASANGGQTTATVNVDAPPSINITSPGANSVYQAGANIAIVADAADPDGTVVRVDFYQGAMLLGSSSAVPYSFTWTNVPPGSYSLTAVATDNQGASNTSSAVTIRVNAPPIVMLTSPMNGATFTAPATIPLAATAMDSDGSITQVDFYQGSTFIGTATSVPYPFSWTNVQPGSYALTARATDNDGAVTISDMVSITVNSGVKQIYYIVPDHLNTPRFIQDQAGNAVWRNDNSEPFGDSVPNDNPSGLGAFDFPLRFPGQYKDRETNLNYNLMRDYDAAAGRYIQSDPIGLARDLNSYLYSNANPVLKSDASGLFSSAMHEGMTYQAMVAEGFSPATADQVAQEVVQVDASVQTHLPSDAYRHAMCGPLTSKAECARRYRNYLEEQLYLCNPEALARGMHDLQDSFARGHSGFQSWPPVAYSLIGLILKTYEHIDEDRNPSIKEMDDSIRASREYIKRYKETCLVCAGSAK